MTEEQGFEILERIAAAYTQFDLSGQRGEKRIEIWLEHLVKMPYEQVLNNLNYHISTNRFPPTVADIAAEMQENNHFVDLKKRWEEQVKAERSSGKNIKTALDYLPEEMRNKYKCFMKESNHGSF